MSVIFLFQKPCISSKFLCNTCLIIALCPGALNKETVDQTWKTSRTSSMSRKRGPKSIPLEYLHLCYQTKHMNPTKTYIVEGPVARASLQWVITVAAGSGSGK